MLLRSLLASLVIALLMGPLGPAAHASHGHDDVRTSGHCPSGVHWKLKAKHDDGRIEVEGEIDSNRPGQTWHWVFKHNGSTSAKGSKKTSGSSGSFEVQRRMTDLSGQDHFVFRAKHGGTVCRGTISA